MLRRYKPLEAKPRIDPDIRRVRAYVAARDRDCVGKLVGFPIKCFGRPEMDHVRASGGLGMKSRTAEDNCVMLCSEHHRFKTLNGKLARPALIDYLNRVEGIGLS